ncbi:MULTISPECIES: hypothetical protein [Vibrio]|uniref:Uncharacterized protein n=1 Tax=Vibrio tasmaniensis TaxID=212663 RepID=A0A2N7NNB7_9VIBR|nr:hypothetical protein [Vibrio tasmaniensis]PMO89899.1 hypothetical protein BCT01_01045 [Vibrio tasmaniensis]PMP17766.1 hypothetical protein BCS92_05000 [Vibrio tasmaniensis]TKG28004.1 hypothetical protein FC057_22720 [Vibrio tasmaniensis]TKG41631.1 hypothetical protein FC063_07150 [Vibrio tasmaniensis]TKG44875.1 hypothetical protein FC061_20285 [Vibrio tasmaniensis]
MNQFILRIYNDSVILQQVTKFQRIPHQSETTYSEHQLKGFSDWNNSGDLIKATFGETVASIQYELKYHSFSISNSSNIQMYQFSKIKGALRQAEICDKKLDKVFSDLDVSPRSMSNLELILALATTVKVVGGTIDMRCSGGINRSFTMESPDKLKEILIHCGIEQ